MFSEILQGWLNACRDLETMGIKVIRREATFAKLQRVFSAGLLEPMAPAVLPMMSACSRSSLQSKPSVFWCRMAPLLLPEPCLALGKEQSPQVRTLGQQHPAHALAASTRTRCISSTAFPTLTFRSRCPELQVHSVFGALA